MVFIVTLIYYLIMKDNWNYIRIKIQYFGDPKTFKRDNRLKFNFILLDNYYIENNITLINSSHRNPQIKERLKQFIKKLENTF